MPINSLTRVMWRIRENTPKTGKTCPKTGKTQLLLAKSTLKKAIIQEIGYSPQTYYRIRSVLRQLGWIKVIKNGMYVTEEGLNA